MNKIKKNISRWVETKEFKEDVSNGQELIWTEDQIRGEVTLAQVNFHLTRKKIVWLIGVSINLYFKVVLYHNKEEKKKQHIFKPA